MTAEQRLVFDLTDILAVRLECAKCRSAVSVNPADWRNVWQCPNCQDTWELPQVHLHLSSIS